MMVRQNNYVSKCAVLCGQVFHVDCGQSVTMKKRKFLRHIGASLD